MRRTGEGDIDIRVLPGQGPIPDIGKERDAGWKEIVAVSRYTLRVWL